MPPSSAPTSAAGATPLEARGLVAGYYPGHTVLRGVSLTAAPGRVTVLLGPNGSGKSTLLKAIFGLLLPSAGEVLLGETPVTRLSPERRRRLGMALLPQGHSIFPRLSVEENLAMGAWAFRGERGRVRRAIEEAYGRYPQLVDVRRRPAGLLSGGQQRILELARLTMGDPQVILVDEPSVGVAPNVVAYVYEAVRSWRQEGRTVLLVDQNVEDAVAVADAVVILEYGAVTRVGDAQTLRADLEAVIQGWLRLSG